MIYQRIMNMTRLMHKWCNDPIHILSMMKCLTWTRVTFCRERTRDVDVELKFEIEISWAGIPLEFFRRQKAQDIHKVQTVVFGKRQSKSAFEVNDSNYGTNQKSWRSGRPEQNKCDVCTHANARPSRKKSARRSTRWWKWSMSAWEWVALVRRVGNAERLEWNIHTEIVWSLKFETGFIMEISRQRMMFNKNRNSSNELIVYLLSFRWSMLQGYWFICLFSSVSPECRPIFTLTMKVNTL